MGPPQVCLIPAYGKVEAEAEGVGESETEGDAEDDADGETEGEVEGETDGDFEGTAEGDADDEAGGGLAKRRIHCQPRSRPRFPLIPLLPLLKLQRAMRHPLRAQLFNASLLLPVQKRGQLRRNDRRARFS